MAEKEDLTRIGIEIDKDLKADVKVKCAREGLTITKVVTQLLEGWTNDS